MPYIDEILDLHAASLNTHVYVHVLQKSITIRKRGQSLSFHPPTVSFAAASQHYVRERSIEDLFILFRHIVD